MGFFYRILGCRLKLIGFDLLFNEVNEIPHLCCTDPKKLDQKSNDWRSVFYGQI